MPDPAGHVVSDAGPLIALAKIGNLQLLQQCYGTVLISDAVFKEITGARFAEASDILGSFFLEKRRLKGPIEVLLRAELDEGEAESIALAVETNAVRLLMDERKGRRIATVVYGLTVTGTAGVLVRAKQSGFVKTIRPLLEGMKTNGYFLSDHLIDSVCRGVGE